MFIEQRIVPIVGVASSILAIANHFIVSIELPIVAIQSAVRPWRAQFFLPIVKTPQ